MLDVGKARKYTINVGKEAEGRTGLRDPAAYII